VKRFGLVGICLLIGGGVHAATITNGSFEGPGTYSGPFQTLVAGSGALPGWTIEYGSIDLINTLWQHGDGNYSLDLDGNSPSSISQEITGLTSGQSYSILFDMAGNPGGGDAIKHLTVAAGNDVGRYTFDITGKSVTNMGWQTMQFDFTADASSVILEFMSGSASGPFGPALDNVRFTPAPAPVPLPAGMGLMLSGLGLMALRRRKG
jgi:choice-of-anchor C domain-containing protein